MTWFRLYTDLMHDPKVQLLKPDTFKAWINVLCLASANKPRGYLPPLADIAFKLRMSEKKAKLMMDELFAAGLLDTTPEAMTRPHNWDVRQHEGDTSTARSRRFRQRRRSTVAVPVTRASYAEYLASEHWLARRERALDKADGCCGTCGETDGILDVHHNTYERLGEELDSDLIVLCRTCHGLFHDNGKLARPID